MLAAEDAYNWVFWAAKPASGLSLVWTPVLCIPEDSVPLHMLVLYFTQPVFLEDLMVPCARAT